MSKWSTNSGLKKKSYNSEFTGECANVDLGGCAVGDSVEIRDKFDVGPKYRTYLLIGLHEGYEPVLLAVEEFPLSFLARREDFQLRR